MRQILLILLAFTWISISNAQEPLKLTDFEILNNTSWEGQLTYKDDQSGKMTPVVATMQIKIKNDHIITNVQYTYEPNKITPPL